MAHYRARGSHHRRTRRPYLANDARDTASGCGRLAAKVGITAGHLSRIESGERRATPEVMQRICDTIAALPA